jgi:hypothetical protein
MGKNRFIFKKIRKFIKKGVKSFYSFTPCRDIIHVLLLR